MLKKKKKLKERFFFLISLVDLEDADHLIVVANEEGVAVLGEGKGEGRELLEGSHDLVLVELGDELLLREVVDLDRVTDSGSEPDLGGGEGECIDRGASLEGGDVLVLGKVPDVDETVLASSGADGAVGADSDGVHIALVADKGVTELEVGEIPDLDGLVPGGRDEERLGGIGGDADAGDPLSVALEGVLALAEGVPEPDGLVAGARDDLTVVSREGNRENVLAVADEATDGLAGLDVPEAHGPVPAAREDVAGVVGEGDVLDKVGVAVEGAEGLAVGLGGLGEVPDHDGLVAGAREEGVGLLGGGGEAGDCTVMTDKVGAEGDGGHFCYYLMVVLFFMVLGKV